MADVVHQDGCTYGFSFTVEDEVTFGRKLGDGFAHEVKSSQGVLEACVLRSWVDNRGEPHLLDAVQALKQGVLHNVVQQSFGNVDKPKDRIVYYLTLVQIGERLVSQMIFFSSALISC